MSSRAVIVDDSSSRIQYEGSWIQDSGSRDLIGNYGPTFKSTLHGAQTSASLSFLFSGTSVMVFGSNNLRNDSGVLDPTWECFVDNISIGATKPFQYPENNWPFCEKRQLDDGPHILTVNATVAKKQTFWFDRIHYTPSPTASTEEQLVFVDNSDPDLNFGSGWAPLASVANTTNEKNTTFEFEFTGVSLSWFGLIPEELPGKSTTATYAIDGGSPQAFNLKGRSTDSGSFFHQKFFETPTLPMGRHKLLVVHNGNSNTTPLTLDYLVVQNGTVSSSGNGGATNSNSNGVKRTNIGAIIGGVVSGVAVILLLLAFLFFRRSQKTKKQSPDLRENNPRVHPFQYQPVPFPTSPPSTLPRKITGLDAPNTSGIESSSSPGTQPAIPLPIVSGKNRELMLQRADPQVHSDVAPTRFVRHEDSGMRMREDNPEEVVELPPQYTVG